MTSGIEKTKNSQDNFAWPGSAGPTELLKNKIFGLCVYPLIDLILAERALCNRKVQCHIALVWLKVSPVPISLIITEEKLSFQVQFNT